MTNHLAHETSPYLLQHAGNPVDWYPWGSQALAKAQAEDKPIFLSIGYAACHWCHVMAHESFEDPAIARLMNATFVSIKVDREERPDLDSIFMSFVVALTGQGGWPMSVFLTPDGKPFYGGTYYPPAPLHNLPSFRQVLEAIARLWQEDRPRLLSSAEDLTAQLTKPPHGAPQAGKLSPEILELAASVAMSAYDWQYGGWGAAPKFPQPMLIEFLLQRAHAGDATSLKVAAHALACMAQGGMLDLLGGGFARYSVDPTWLVPHFEKMLYDNAQLALVYLHAFQFTHEPSCRRVCETTLDFVLRELTHPQGGFYSSLDADSEGQEGKFYLWTPEEVRSALPNPQEAELALAAYGITPAGNFDSKSILRASRSHAELADLLHLPVESLPDRLESVLTQLLAARSRRVRPATDDKVLVSWNALMLKAFAEAGRALNRPDYVMAARRNADFILSNMLQSTGRLSRSWRQGDAKHSAYLEDYAGLGLALLSLYQADLNLRWYQAAIHLMDVLQLHFTDPADGFFDTPDDHETLLYRPKERQDNATPSGNALAAMLLLQLSAYEGRSDWRDMAEAMLASNLGLAKRYPSAFGMGLQAASFALRPQHAVAIIGSLEDPATQALLEALAPSYHPDMLLAACSFPPPKGSPALLQDRPLLGGKPTAYVCQDFVCKRPVNTPAEMLEQLSPEIPSARRS